MSDSTVVDSIFQLLKVLDSAPPKEANTDVWMKYCVPVVLILFGFLIKTVIDRKASTDETIESVFEVPVEITFLSISIFMAFSIYDNNNSSRNLFFIIVLFVIAVLNVFLWRRSILNFNDPDTRSYAKKYFIPNLIVSTAVFILLLVFI